jgi:hypothetical protein
MPLGSGISSRPPSRYRTALVSRIPVIPIQPGCVAAISVGHPVNGARQQTPPGHSLLLPAVLSSEQPGNIAILPSAAMAGHRRQLRFRQACSWSNGNARCRAWQGRLSGASIQPRKHSELDACATSSRAGFARLRGTATLRAEGNASSFPSKPPVIPTGGPPVGACEPHADYLCAERSYSSTAFGINSSSC